jgi:hypothetical protein
MSSAIQFHNLYGYQIANILEKEMKKQIKKNELLYQYGNNNVFICNNCNKRYKNKINYDKHCLLCDFSIENSKESNETSPLVDPTHPVNSKINDCLLIELLKDLLIKYNKLSNEMCEIKKWMSREKKQINILDWLNHNNPIEFQTISSFDEFINNFMISEEYIKKITTSSILDLYLYSIDDLFSNDIENISSNTTNPITPSPMPICCFSQKVNVFYIYTEICTKSAKSIEFHWREASNEDLLRIFNKTKNKLITELCKWNDFQQNQIAETNSNHNHYNNAKDKLDELFNKSILKLMTDISNNHIFQKLKSKLYHKLKTDIKQYVEYEFTFNKP